jgi:hypothetical protein
MTVKSSACLLAVSLCMVACNVSTASQASNGLPGLVAVEGYRVRDVSGQFSSRVGGVIVEPLTGEVRYLVIEVPTSAFALDHSTADLVGSECILVPWRFVTVDPVDRSLILSVNLNELERSPHFQGIPDQLPPDWIELLDAYWSTILK